jgi:Tfp pilus assembly protein PilF
MDTDVHWVWGRAAMRTLAAAGALLLLVSLTATAQTTATPESFVVTVQILSPHASSDNELEVRLSRENGVVLETVRARLQERFDFQVGFRGNYYIELDVPGYKKVRRLVEVADARRDLDAQIMLEAQAEIVQVTPSNLTGEKGVVHATEMSQSESVLKDLKEAQAKLQKGAVDEAQSLLQSLVLEAPVSYDAHKDLGIAYQQGHRYPEAEREFQIALKLRPQSAEPLIYLGGLYLEQTEVASSDPAKAAEALDKANNVLEQAAALNPQAAFARYLLGVVHLKQGRFTEAEEQLVKTLELEPRLGDARLALANIAIRLRNWPRALAQLEAYLKENPHAPVRDNVVEIRTQLERMLSGG